jgi:voltage-gated potassium channel
MVADSQEDVRLARLEKVLTFPTLLTVVGLLVLLLVPLTASLDARTSAVIARATLVFAGLFVAEYGTRFIVARDKGAFVRGNLIDTAVAISTLFLPILPDSRFLLALRVFSAVSMILEVGKDFQHIFRVRNIPYALIGATLVIAVCGVLEFHYENPVKGSNINSAQDGIWWAAVTMSTVGYGDKYPITPEGRTIAIVLMALGPVFLGILYAGLSSLFMKPTQEELAAEIEAQDRRTARVVEATVNDRFHELSEKIDRLLAATEQRSQE